MSKAKKFDVQHSYHFDFRHSNVERQTVLTFDICQTDVRYLNVESQNDINVEHQTVLTFDIRMLKVKMIQMGNVKLF